MRKSAPKQHAASPERRKSKRFSVTIPVEVNWSTADGTHLKEQAQAKQVNLHGGLLQMKTYPEAGCRIELVNFLSAQAAQARVLGARYSEEGALLGVAVELVVPSEAFWGVNFQLKKTNAELHKLEEALKSGGVDLRLLKEFRDAVDCIRMAAGAVQELLERQQQGRGQNVEVLSKLRVERIRRATQLCLDLADDLATSPSANEAEVIAELRGAIQRIQRTLESTARAHAPKPQFAAHN